MFKFTALNWRAYVGNLSSNIHTKYSVTHLVNKHSFFVIDGTIVEAKKSLQNEHRRLENPNAFYFWT